jgi:hypothetical protein
LRQLSHKFKSEQKVSVFDETEEETTSRKIYKDDYELLRKLGYLENKKHNVVLFEIIDFVRPILVEGRYDELPFVERPYKVMDSHKAVRIMVEDNELLAIHAKRQNISMKRLISSCIKYYKQFKLDDKSQAE